MIEVATPAQMFGLGEKLGSQFKAGDLILLNGPLGAGKTVLAQGIGAALGFAGVTSPTFVISRTYLGNPSLIHVDVYRLLQSENPNLSLDDLDIDSEREEAVTLVEWGGSVAARLSDERLEISIDRAEEIRKVSAVGFGSRWAGFNL